MEGSSSHAGLSGWKRLFLIAFGIGVGVVLSGALLIGVYVWYSERPKPWNTTAIIATYQGVDSATNRTVAQSERKDWVRFYYIFKNTTEADYQLDSISSRLMASLKDTGSLLHAPELDTGMVMSLESSTSRCLLPLPRTFTTRLSKSHCSCCNPRTSLIRYPPSSISMAAVWVRV